MTEPAASPTGARGGLPLWLWLSVLTAGILGGLWLAGAAALR